MPKWTGTAGDSGLVGLVPLLESKLPDQFVFHEPDCALAMHPSYRHPPAAGRKAHFEAV